LFLNIQEEKTPDTLHITLLWTVVILPRSSAREPWASKEPA